MLFRTVYGAELVAIYDFIRQHTQTHAQIPITSIYDAFVATENDTPHENHHVDDAVSFLVSALMIEVQDGQVRSLVETVNFRLELLRNLRRLELGQTTPLHPLDPYYMHILSEVFIRTGRQYVRDLHTEVNQLEPIQAAGGVSREKVQVWKRVMAYLGLGYRAFNGFLCVYASDLLLAVLDNWGRESDTLQSLFEDHIEQYVPTSMRIGDVAPSLAEPLVQLSEQGFIDLYPLQDSPSRAFFGSHQYKGIRKQTAHV